jgi:hypothetical protein
VQGEVGMGPTEMFVELMKEISSGRHNKEPMTIDAVAIDDQCG